MSQRPRIYLDHAATTPILPAAKAAMTEAMERWANPSSPHAEGRAARAALEDARARIKRALGWDGEVIFTSGASEAIDIALRGRPAGQLAVTAVEHDAVHRAAGGAARLPVSADGVIDPAQALPATAAIQVANNETGVLQPWRDLAPLRAQGHVLLADAAQSAGKLALPDADMVAVSAHKLGGPPGVGALLVRSHALLKAIGGQEQGYRPGTHNLPGIVGFAAALETREDWMERAAELRARLEARLVAAGAEVVAAGAPRIPTIGAYRMAGVPSEAQLIHFDLSGIAVSAGSACSSGSLKPSHVLAAMGWDETASREIIRVSFGPQTTAQEVDACAAAWEALAQRRSAA
ncbi:aminotransferase class V-fold PLP-dependent enzyme [Sphingosinicella sp. YJ22]|uniref:cysteine desulfurase family protein n=1 Tax=Sphingosinicella sp. YJ22 TaxID=1104780 RepID=UPI00140BF9D7|nr:aminotransferase class V-fold PLP-dependent enzyme [Sphingosinicella sp. YJ22]